MSDTQPAQRTMPLQVMTSPVFVTIKSLKFHNPSAYLCHRDKAVSKDTSAEKPFLPAEHERDKTRARCLLVIPTNPSETARDEG